MNQGRLTQTTITIHHSLTISSRFAKPEREYSLAGIQANPVISLPTVPLPASRDAYTHHPVFDSNTAEGSAKIGVSTIPSEKGTDTRFEADTQPRSATLEKPATQVYQSSVTKELQRRSTESEKQSTAQDPPHPQDRNDSGMSDF